MNWRKIAFLSVLPLLFPLVGAAHNLECKVVDAQSGAPIVDAYVYLDGTSFMARTGRDGVFRLELPEGIKSMLYIRHVGYGVNSMHLGFDEIPKVIELRQKSYIIQEVQVLPYKRDEILAFFHRCFFGNTIAAKNCVLNNPDVLQFRFEDENGGLSVTTGDSLLHVTNGYLGYDVYFMINDNYIGLKKRFDIRSGDNYQYGDYECTFVDISNGRKKFKRRRYEAYRGSKMAFWRSIFSEPLDKSKFIIKRSRSGGRVANNAELRWIITDTLGMKKVTIDIPPRSNGSHPNPNYANRTSYDSFYVSHEDFWDEPMFVRFYEREFYIDEFGTYMFPGEKPRYRGMATAWGHMNRLGAANALPKDYMPGN